MPTAIASCFVIGLDSETSMDFATSNCFETASWPVISLGWSAVGPAWNFETDCSTATVNSMVVPVSRPVFGLADFASLASDHLATDLVLHSAVANRSAIGN